MPDQSASQSFHIPAATSDDGVNDTNDSLTLWAWTQSGFPIVDRKYIGNGTLKDANPTKPSYQDHRRWLCTGTTAISVRSRDCSGGVAAAGFVNVTEYTVRLGSFLAETKGRL